MALQFGSFPPLLNNAQIQQPTNYSPATSNNNVQRIPTINEPFEINQQQTISTVETIFISMATMIGSSLLAILFYWSYQKLPSLFIAIYSIIVLCYSIETLVFIIYIRSQLTPFLFKFYLGSAVFMSFLSLMVTIYFAVKSFSRSSYTNQSSSYSTQEVSAQGM